MDLPVRRYAIFRIIEKKNDIKEILNSYGESAKEGEGRWKVALRKMDEDALGVFVSTLGDLFKEIEDNIEVQFRK